MKRTIKTQAQATYKGHVIRKVEDEFGNVEVLIDNESDTLEDSIMDKQVNEFTYASIADAKRAIRNEPITWWPLEAEIRNEEYFTRFK